MSALHEVTLGDVLDGHRRNRPRALAAVCGSARLDYEALDSRVARLASALGALGTKEGDRVLWLGQNCHRLLEGLLACARIGAVFCPANWRQSAAELAFVIEDSAPSVVIWQQEEIGGTAAEARALAEKASEGAAGGPRWLCHDDPGPDGYEALLDSAPGEGAGMGGPAGSGVARPSSARDSDPVLMMYTAAFSGTPNGALLSHRALVTQGALISQLQSIDPNYVYLNCGPLFHVATFMTTLATFVTGGTNVFTRRVDAEEICRLVHEERCTGAFVMGPTMDQMVEANADGRYDLSSLRTFAGKPAWTAMITVDDSPWGRHPGGYGQTEVMGLATFGALGPSKGSHGRPPGFLQIAVLGPSGEEVPPGETGEIVLKGPTVMNGYHNRPEQTAERQRGGWHHTGDLGRIEDDGSLTFIGPKTRIVKSAAENIYPVEVESCLKTHAAVADAAVIGVPDRTWGQNVKAIVVLKEGASATEAELIEHCRERIASYKKPKSVEFVDALPRQGFAIDYDALDERFGGGGYPGTGA